jgi:geranylgeranylglycerol-phosphate geranylgeranyltransferase
MIGFAVIVGEIVSGPPTISPLQSALGFLTGFFVCAYSMVVNDIYDLEVDRINQPRRPIPSGKISVPGATRISIAMLIAGFTCAFLSLNFAAVAVAAIYASLSWLYNFRAKKSGIAGNAIVASSLAIPFVYGGIVSGGSSLSPLLILMALTAFLSGVGREVVKAMADVDGDARRGISSVARESGMKVAAYVGGCFFVLAVVTSWIPLVTGLANEIYTLGVLVPDAIFAYLTWTIIRNGSQENARRVKTYALMGMLAGLLVFVGGGV